MDNVFKELKKPFSVDKVKWRVQSCGISNGNAWAMVLVFIDSRAVMDRLDDVVGPAHWQDDIRSLDNGKTFCELSIRIDGEWISKTGVAGETNYEGAKGGASDSFKRAGVKFGIGRYLYDMDEQFASKCQKKKPKNWRQNGWKRAKTKDNQVLYWKPPKLPGWAKPDSNSGQATTDSQQDKTQDKSKNDKEEKSKVIDDIKMLLDILEWENGTAQEIMEDAVGKDSILKCNAYELQKYRKQLKAHIPCLNCKQDMTLGEIRYCYRNGLKMKCKDCQ